MKTSQKCSPGDIIQFVDTKDIAVIVKVLDDNELIIRYIKNHRHSQYDGQESTSAKFFPFYVVNYDLHKIYYGVEI